MKAIPNPDTAIGACTVGRSAPSTGRLPKVKSWPPPRYCARARLSPLGEYATGVPFSAPHMAGIQLYIASAASSLPAVGRRSASVSSQ